MLNLITKLNPDRYLSSMLILCIDMLLSALASLLALIVVQSLFRQVDMPGSLIFVWEGMAIAVSMLLFCTLKTYRFIIRHSTLREIAKFVDEHRHYCTQRVQNDGSHIHLYY